MKRTAGSGCLLFIVMVLTMPAYGQHPGARSFQFLHTPASARMAALGGTNVSLADRDINFFYANPALNGDSLAGFVSANYRFYAGDVGQAALTYAHKFRKPGTITFGIQHMNYGDIAGFDDSGIETGVFKAQETALVAGASQQIGNYRLGASLKGIFSNLAGYRSTAAAIDLGGIFIHPNKRLTAALSIRNIGVVFSDYSESANTRLPFDVQVGTTFKPEFMPMRFSLSAYNLGEFGAGSDELSPVQKAFTHLIFGSEILLHRNVNVLVGYNYRTHRDLITERGGGGAGISLGFSATIRSVDFVFSRSAYMAGNAAYSFTLSGNLNKYLKRG